jgi:septum formation protein
MPKENSLMPQLILASTSPYRKEFLKRLGLPFDSKNPQVDESENEGETASKLAIRLAHAKADRIAKLTKNLNTVIIGADQAASINNKLLRKPGNMDNALRQLMACQGKVVSFYTACCVIDLRSKGIQQYTDKTQVRFLTLHKKQLERYIQVEKPFNCAGGFKAEGLGISLFQSISSSDPTALLGLPLIWLAGVLRDLDLDPLKTSTKV